MKISVEISMYPLNAEYIEPITKFIKVLHTYLNLEVRTNGMSTQIFGEYDDVFAALADSMKAGMVDGKVVFVTKFLNTDVSAYKSDF